MAISAAGIRAATLEVHITGDHSDLDRGIDSSEGKLRSFASGAAKAGLIAAGAGAAAGIAFGVKAVQGASDLSEQVSKANVVFGESAKIVHDFTAQMAKDFGIPKVQIIDAAASIGLIGKASGLSQPAAAKMSTEMAKLAVDASSFYNVPLEEALTSIRSGLVGEAEPMRRFGVLLNAQAVDAEAARLGLEKVNGAYTEGAKAQARASLIMSGMKDASGDLERTQGSLANRLREVQGRAVNFAADIGTKMLPAVLGAFDVFEAFSGKLSGRVGPAIGEITGSFKAFGAAFRAGDGDITSSGLPGFFELIGYWVRVAFDTAQEVIPPIAAALMDFGKAVLPPLVTAFAAVGAGAIKFVQAVGPPLVAAIKPAIGIIKNLITAFMPELGIAIGVIIGLAGEIAGKLLDVLAPALRVVETATGGLRAAFENPVFQVFAAFIAGTFIPALVGIGIQAGISALQVVAAWVLIGAQAVASAVVSAAQFAIMGLGWVAAGVTAVVNAALVVGGWVAMAVAATVNAAIMAAAWFIALGPVAWVIAGIAALAIIIWRNWDTIKEAFTAGARWVGERLGDVINFFRDLPGKIWNVVAGAATWLKNTGVNIIAGLLNGIAERLVIVWDWFRNIPTNIWNLLSGASEWLINTGKNIIIGFWNGIASMGGWLWDQISGFISRNVPGPVKSVLGIFSPSRVMAGFGRDVGRGLVDGISGMEGAVARAAADLAKSAMPDMPATTLALEVSVPKVTPQEIMVDVLPRMAPQDLVLNAVLPTIPPLEAVLNLIPNVARMPAPEQDRISGPVGDWAPSPRSMAYDDAGIVAAPAGSTTYVDIKVAGSVVTQRELFAAFREWLIQTGRANGGDVIGGFG